MELSMRELMVVMWNLFPLHLVQHPTFWHTFSMILEDPAKQIFQQLTTKWGKNYYQWQIGSLIALEKKCGKTIDFISPMFLPVTTEEELENWLQSWYVEQSFTQESLSSSACMVTMSTPSTTVPTPTGRVGARLKNSKRQKRTLDDFFADLGESKRSRTETGKIVSNIIVRKDGQLRTVSSEGQIKDFVMKLQIFPTLEYQAAMNSKPTDAWRTATIRAQLRCSEREEIYQKVLEILSLGREDILRCQSEDSE
ncbi:hypothetical protein HHI36_022519 [Cryptolaemus montrouzieri]|uniref:Uncharacterized protein n=1 Tax=Cryptolaemus montrouzieri TaxID=559131 RepID=A0ABD2N0G8_9CUCU